MHASSPLHDNPNRLMPIVPGINASALKPSIGCDHWRTKASQPVAPKLRHKARPMSGLVDLAKVPASFTTGRPKVQDAPRRKRASNRTIARQNHASRLADRPWN